PDEKRPGGNPHHFGVVHRVGPYEVTDFMAPLRASLHLLTVVDQPVLLREVQQHRQIGIAVSAAEDLPNAGRALPARIGVAQAAQLGKQFGGRIRVRFLAHAVSSGVSVSGPSNSSTWRRNSAPSSGYTIWT